MFYKEVTIDKKNLNRIQIHPISKMRIRGPNGSTTPLINQLFHLSDPLRVIWFSWIRMCRNMAKDSDQVSDVT